MVENCRISIVLLEVLMSVKSHIEKSKDNKANDLIKKSYTQLLAAVMPVCNLVLEE